MHAKCFRMRAECSRMHAVCSRMHADPWACIQLHKLACGYISLHAVTYDCMQLHKLACNYISLHAVPFFVWAAHENFAVLVLSPRHLIENNVSKEEIVLESNIRIIIKNLGLRQDKQSRLHEDVSVFFLTAPGEEATRAWHKYWDYDRLQQLTRRVWLCGTWQLISHLMSHVTWRHAARDNYHQFYTKENSQHI